MCSNSCLHMTFIPVLRSASNISYAYSQLMDSKLGFLFFVPQYYFIEKGLQQVFKKMIWFKIWVHCTDIYSLIAYDERVTFFLALTRTFTALFVCLWFFFT